MKLPNPELIDDENPEWTEEDSASSVPFSALPRELHSLLSEPKHVRPKAEIDSSHQRVADTNSSSTSVH